MNVYIFLKIIDTKNLNLYNKLDIFYFVNFNWLKSQPGLRGIPCISDSLSSGLLPLGTRQTFVLVPTNTLRFGDNNLSSRR